MRAVLHPLAYPLKPLTQASISMLPIPILHATHNNVLPYPDVSHPKSLLRRHFYPGVSHPESLLRRHSIRVSHTRNPSCAAILSGCLTSGITPAPPFYPGVSHPEFYPRPTFHLLRVSHTRNPIRRRSTLSGCLISGILSSRRSTFFFILRAFSLGSKITFLIKLCCHFYLWQSIFILPLFFKMF